MNHFSCNPFGKSHISLGNISKEMKSHHNRLRPKGFNVEKKVRFSNIHDNVVGSAEPLDAWVVLEEMLYEQDCRFSSGQ